MMKELTLFTKALGLSEPWEVVDIKLSKEEGRLDLKIDFTKGAKFTCPSCEGKECKIHDTRERRWRHLNFFQYETYLHARVPRIKCRRGGIKQIEVPWSRPGSGFTLLFEMLVLQFCREMSVSSVAEVVCEQANRIWRVLSHYVEKAHRRVDLSTFHILGLDEFSARKGYVYMTSFSDLESSRVIYVGGAGAKRWWKNLLKISKNEELIQSKSM